MEELPPQGPQFQEEPQMQQTLVLDEEAIPDSE